MKNDSSDWPQKVALVYDRVNTWGGAERVLQALHQIYPESELFTSVYDSDGAPWADGWKINTSWLQKIPWARTHHRFFGWLMPWLFESFDLSAYDLVISVTSEAAKAVRTKPEQLHVCYILTPTRYLWSHADAYLRQLPFPLNIPAKLLFSLLRKIDVYQSSRPDAFVAISKVVARRVEDNYGRKCSDVIYPPLSALASIAEPSHLPSKKFLFTWGRLVPYKQFDQSLRAAVLAKISLLIAGVGPDRARLEELAQKLDPKRKYISFLGAIDEAQLSWYLEHAQAALFPQVEDFGISTLEALECGCPVLVNAGSGVSELLQNHLGVIFLDGEKSENIANGISVLRHSTWPRLDIRLAAQQYAGARFEQQWIALIKKMRKGKL